MNLNQETTYIAPPPGPLTWLFPELARVSSRPAGAVLDLSRIGLCGSRMIEALAAQRTGRIIIEDGPRGHTLWSWLSQQMRGGEMVVDRPSPDPPPLAGRSESAPGECFHSWPLESMLTAAAGLAGEGEAVLVTIADEGSCTFHTVSLCDLATHYRHAGPGRDRNILPLLPLRPGRGLEQRLELALEEVSRQAGAFRRIGLIPYFVTQAADRDSPAPFGRVETRLLPSWWGVLPGDAYPRPVRELYRRLIRRLHPDRMFLFLTFENHALAGIDLYGESLAGRFTAGSSAASGTTTAPGRSGNGRTPLVISVCGIDGSGKSSHVAALEQYLTGRGLRVSVQKIYRHGVFHDTVTDLTRQCAGSRNLHLWRIQRIAKALDSIKYFYSAVSRDLDSCDAVIFDRYVHTHFAAGAGRYHHDPFTRELLAVYPPADRIYLLDTPVEVALRRIGARDKKTVDENPYMLSRYRHALLDLAQRHGFLVLDSRTSFEENSRTILEDTAGLMEAKGAAP